MSKKNNIHILFKKYFIAKNVKHSELSVNYSSTIKDHWSPNIIIMKNSEIFWELPNCDTETWNEQMPLKKKDSDRHARCRIVPNVQFAFF